MKRALPIILALGLSAALASTCLAAQAQQTTAGKAADYSAEIAAAQERLDAFLAAFNKRDIAAYEDTFNYPHVRFASGKVNILKRGDHSPQMFAKNGLEDWHHSAWLRRDVIHAGPDKVHINTRFARYRADGSLIGAFDSIYIVTKVDGRWGIQSRSSFAP